MVAQSDAKNPAEDARAAALCARLLREGIAVRLRLGGGSMRPFLRHGDCCVLEPARHRKLESGDIVAYLNLTGNLTVHRIVAARQKDGKPGFMTKGDMTNWKEWVAAAAVLGRVVSVERSGRKSRLDTPFARVRGKVVGILSPIVSVAGECVLSLAGSVRKGRRGRF